MRGRSIILFFLVMGFHFDSFSQGIYKDLQSFTSDTAYINKLRREHGNRKKIPAVIESQVLVALSYYPELRNIKIEFKIRKSKSALLAKPTLYSAFFRNPAKRRYIVVISKQPCKYLEHIQFYKLPVNGQIGVLGHELAHISDFTRRNGWSFLEIAFGNLSPRWLDRYEYQTDKSTIEHGLGYQLLSWSLSVRDILQIRKYLGGYDVNEEHVKVFQESERERYMNPETIAAIIKEHPLYRIPDEKAVE